MKEADGTIVVWGHYDWRFDVHESAIIAVGRNVILDMDYSAVFKYKVGRDAPMPSGLAYAPCFFRTSARLRNIAFALTSTRLMVPESLTICLSYFSFAANTTEE